MIRKELVKTIIADNQQSLLPELWVRNLKIPIDTNKIVTLIGVRRSGKTYHLYEIIKELVNNGVPRSEIIYINFEDERLDLGSQDLDVIIQAYRELYPNVDLGHCHFLFDEVQMVSGWEKFVDRIFESISKNIYITGSNSKLLSKEIATALRGRTITYEIYPLSFAEYVSVLSPGLNIATSAGQTKTKLLFADFVSRGGFPETVRQSVDVASRILQEYFGVMILRDLVERYDIGQVALLKYFCKRAIGASAGEFSVNKIYNELKSQGYKISKDSLYAYQDNVEAIFMSRLVAKYSESVVKSEGSAKKIYAIDTGLGSAVDYKLASDKGRLLETVVLLELLKAGKVVNYYNEGVECDFVVTDRGQVVTAMQVSVDLYDPTTRKRELKGLISACKNLHLSEGYIITQDTQEEVVVDGIKVFIVPAWKYFLDSTIH
jgi:uncharacterized protein